VTAVRDHCGDPVPLPATALSPGLARIAVPRAGLVELSVG
jgi:hypothetical protein